MAYFTTTVSNKLVALDTATGTVLKEIDVGPVWCGPTVSRGRVYVGTGNLLFAPGDPKEAYFPKSATGAVYSFGLPGEDEVSRMGVGEGVEFGQLFGNEDDGGHISRFRGLLSRWSVR